VVRHFSITFVLPFCVPPSLLSFFFFFYSYLHHRDLHSFPTRRSSDLCVACRNYAFCFPSTHLYISNIPVDILAYGISFFSRRPRSEEHTSELQSRFDLVCRLLLEKKKKSNSIIKLRVIFCTKQ